MKNGGRARKIIWVSWKGLSVQHEFAVSDYSVSLSWLGVFPASEKIMHSEYRQLLAGKLFPSRLCLDYSGRDQIAICSAFVQFNSGRRLPNPQLDSIR